MGIRLPSLNVQCVALKQQKELDNKDNVWYNIYI